MATHDGRTLSGLQFHYRGNMASLIVEDGSEVRLHLAEIEEMRASRQSLRPDGLPVRMTVADVRDLLAFLLTRR